MLLFVWEQPVPAGICVTGEKPLPASLEFYATGERPVKPFTCCCPASQRRLCSFSQNCGIPGSSPQLCHSCLWNAARILHFGPWWPTPVSPKLTDFDLIMSALNTSGPVLQEGLVHCLWRTSMPVSYARLNLGPSYLIAALKNWPERWAFKFLHTELNSLSFVVTVVAEKCCRTQCLPISEKVLCACQPRGSGLRCRPSVQRTQTEYLASEEVDNHRHALPDSPQIFNE